MNIGTDVASKLVVMSQHAPRPTPIGLIFSERGEAFHFRRMGVEAALRSRTLHMNQSAQ